MSQPYRPDSQGGPPMGVRHVEGALMCPEALDEVFCVRVSRLVKPGASGHESNMGRRYYCGHPAGSVLWINLIWCQVGR